MILEGLGAEFQPDVPGKLISRGIQGWKGLLVTEGSTLKS